MLLIHAHPAPSSIHGLGLFADAAIPAGTRVWEFSPGLDLEIPPREFAALPERAKEHIRFYGFLSARTGNYHLSFDNVRFINHSDTPNVACDAGGDGVQLPLVAMRDIAAGEEIVQEYGDFEAEVRFH